MDGQGGGGGQGGTDGEWRTFIPDEATGVSGINIVDIFSADRSLKRRFYKKSSPTTGTRNVTTR